MIPGPKEPKLSINSFLYPLVEELKELWSGVQFECPHNPLGRVTIRAALTCCSCDIPATRKLCGFVGHSAKCGCSKCSKLFPSLRHNQKKRDYSGFDRNDWPTRDLVQHKQQAYNHLNADTRQEQKNIESNYGIRYSVLLELPYWNPIKYSTVDPMHNLFLGTGKHVMKVWVEKGIITKRDFSKLEQVVAKILTPRSVGRIPNKIGSGFSGFTANQWKNWITIFSPVALKEILPTDHLRCWLLYVRACFLICNHIITSQAIEEIDQYLRQFCNLFCQLYGPNACTPNMHLHMHLKECLKNYGPVHTFWCYSFERYNGMLGRYHTNNHSVEVQIMKKFLREAELQSVEPPCEANEVFGVGLLNQDHGICDDTEIWKLHRLALFSNIQSDFSIISNLIHLIPPFFQGVLEPHEKRKIEKVYSYIYPRINIVYFSRLYQSSKRCNMAGEIFSVSSFIAAFWPTESCSSEAQLELQVGIIKNFLKLNIKVKESGQTKEKTHIFCLIDWYMKHPCATHYGSSVIVCTPSTYCSAPCQFMPIQRIFKRCAYGKLDVALRGHVTEQVIAAIPIHLNYIV